MFSRLNNLFWDVTWNVTVFNLRTGKRVLRYVDYRLSRASTPMAEGAASSTAQSGFKSQEAHVRADLTASG